VAGAAAKRLISGFFAPSQPGENTPTLRLHRIISIHQHMKPSKLFHPAVASWFGTCFEAPTSAQAKAGLAIEAPSTLSLPRQPVPVRRWQRFSRRSMI
jgi:hypothetical protein